MMDLSGRQAIVTGGSEGIGRAIVEALAGAGANVALTSRTREKAERVAAEIDVTTAGRVIGLACDVQKAEDCAAMVEAVASELGEIHILVNNAGVGIFKTIQEMTIADYDVQIRTNLDGVFYTTKAAVPHLIAADNAWIINIGSLASRNPFNAGTAYNASKFGLLGMTEAMMLDLRHEGIRVSIVMPGSVNTDFGLGNDRPWAIQPEDIAAGVMSLLAQPQRTHVSRLEVRPSAPPKK